MSTPLHFVILAAGKGTRMKSELPKVLHAVGGEPMIVRILRTASDFAPVTSTVVVGHMAAQVRAALTVFPGVGTVVQEPQLGTGHALMQAAPPLTGQTGTVVLLYGDVPMLSRESIANLLAHHQRTGAAATVLTAHLPNPAGLGRIVREHDRFARIVEERDASPAEKAITEFNSGIYAFALDGLFDALNRIGTANDQGEYYLTDLFGIFRGDGRVVETYTIPDADELRGVNSRAELALMNAQVRDQRNAAVMAAGVTLIDPTSAWIGPEVEIGRDTTIHPNVYLEGKTRIGSNVEIHAGVRVVNSSIGDGTIVQNYCVVRDSSIDQHVSMGPFSHIRPDSHRRRRRPHRQLRRAEEDDARQGRQGQSPRLSRRRHHRRQGERRRRRDHLQLRRREEAPDRDRRRRVHRHRLAARRAGDGRRRRLRRGGIDDHRGRPRRRPGHRPRPTREQGRLGGEAQGQDSGEIAGAHATRGDRESGKGLNTHVRHRRLHR